MNKTPTTRNESELPTFFDEDSAAPEHGYDLTDDAAAYEAEAYDAEGEGEDGAAQVDAREHAEPAAGPTPTTRVGNGLGTTVVGAVLATAGIAVGVLNGPLTAQLSGFGLSSSTLVTVGGALVAAGIVLRRLAQGVHGQAAIRQDLLRLAAAQNDHAERAPAAGDEVQHVLLSLQRQDEKLNNLTKAIKMYGKPLMEIAGTSTEVASTLAQVRAAVDAGQEERRRIATAIAGMAQNAPEVDLGPVQERLRRLEVAVAAVSQRLEQPELQKSLLRLEDAAKATEEKLQRLVQGEKVDAATSKLQASLDGAASKLLDGLGQLRDGNLGGLESSVREIQREIAGVATVVHQIQNSVRTGATRNVAADAATPRPTAAAAAAEPAAATAATTTSAPAPQPSGDSTAADGGGGYQTGARATSGKNVLGAIAKLRQMKS
ncbi:MAG: hypothetical protein RL398_2180 [Planctomycetota bacterium]|jgi:hypothetical protein